MLVKSVSILLLAILAHFLSKCGIAQAFPSLILRKYLPYSYKARGLALLGLLRSVSPSGVKNCQRIQGEYAPMSQQYSALQ